MLAFPTVITANTVITRIRNIPEGVFDDYYEFFFFQHILDPLSELN